jgi:hypothetical protein
MTLTWETRCVRRTVWIVLSIHTSIKTWSTRSAHFKQVRLINVRRPRWASGILVWKKHSNLTNKGLSKVDKMLQKNTLGTWIHLPVATSVINLLKVRNREMEAKLLRDSSLRHPNSRKTYKTSILTLHGCSLFRQRPPTAKQKRRHWVFLQWPKASADHAAKPCRRYPQLKIRGRPRQS